MHRKYQMGRIVSNRLIFDEFVSHEHRKVNKHKVSVRGSENYHEISALSKDIEK